MVVVIRQRTSRCMRDQLRPQQHDNGNQKSRTEELLAETDNFASEKEVTFQAKL